MELTSLIIPILLLVVMYFLLIRPQQKRAKEHRAMINRVEAGQKITTIGGIKGTIKAVDETSVLIVIMLRMPGTISVSGFFSIF